MAATEMQDFGALFDPAWYSFANPDARSSGMTPLAHYAERGSAERRDPNPLFDTNWYLAQNPQIEPTGVGALAHYLLLGAGEGRDPHPLFDTDWYLAQNSDAAESGMNPLAHFLTTGAREGRAPHPSFDRDWTAAARAELQIALPDPAVLRRPRSPLVSVVVPVFNKAPYLRDCLSSILAQTLGDIEIVCIEDGSTDESPAILVETALRDARVFVVRNVVNSGPARSRNAGIHLALGKFIQFTDADDILPRDALATLYEIAKADEVPLVRGSLNSFRGAPEPGNLHASNEYQQICRDRRNVSLGSEPGLWTPWWHTTYLISVPFLHAARASYPNLSNGEDPVFLAALLAAAERLSTTSQITYLRRLPDCRRRTKLEHAIDFVRHAAMVRRIYLDRCPQCWNDGYKPFLLSRVEQFFLKPEFLSEVERDIVKLAMMRADIGSYLPFSDRPQHPGV